MMMNVLDETTCFLMPAKQSGFLNDAGEYSFIYSVSCFTFFSPHSCHYPRSSIAKKLTRNLIRFALREDR